MKLSRIRLDKITIPETRVTAHYDEETAELLKKSLEAMGTVNPIIVVATPEGFEVVDGMHRLEEARARGDHEIDAVVYEGDSKDTLIKNLVLNKVRGKTKASEMVQVIGALYNTYNMDSDEISKETGLPRDYIEKVLAIGSASPEVQDALDREHIGVGHAYEISRLPHFIQQDEVLAKYRVYRFPVKELREQINAVLAEMDLISKQSKPTTEPGPRIPRVYNCEGCKRETDPRYLRPVLLCPDCFGAVWRLSQATEKPEGKTEEVTEGD